MKKCTLNSLLYFDFDFLYNKCIFNKFLIFYYKKIDRGKSLVTQILFHTLLSFFHTFLDLENTFPNPIGTLLLLYNMKNGIKQLLMHFLQKEIRKEGRKKEKCKGKERSVEARNWDEGSLRNATV